MLGARTIGAALVVTAIVAVSVALLGQDQAASDEPAQVFVIMVGPEAALWRGHVNATPATALGAIEAAAEKGNFSIEIETAAHLQPCGGYVAGIMGYREGGSGGWIYGIRLAGSTNITYPLRGACAANVDHGDTVFWMWSQDGSEYQQRLETGQTS